jgi:hypothetical protein
MQAEEGNFALMFNFVGEEEMKTLTAFVLAALAGASVANAGIVGKALTVNATNALGTASYVIEAPADSEWNPDGTWSRTISSVELRTDLGELVSVLTDLKVSFIADPVISVNFTASAAGSTTNFVFASGILNFPALTGVTATASAGYSLTDRNGDGATLTGAYSGNAYRADTNGLVPAGNLFATLAPDLTFATPFNTVVSSSNAAGAIAGSVSSMSSQFEFSLSAFDLASGTSVFTVVPTPGAAMIAGLGGLLAARRRRA